MSFSIEFQVTKLQEGEVEHRTAVEKDKPALAGKLNLTDDCLVQMARSITILTQCYKLTTSLMVQERCSGGKCCVWRL